MMILNTVFKKMSVASAACFIGLSGVAVAADDTSIYAGVNHRDQANFSYIGVTHNLTDEYFAEGVLIRAKAGVANYDYSTTLQPKVDGKADMFEFMIGYQKAMQTYLARAFIGLDYEDHTLNPDNLFDKNRGSDQGAKVALEVETDPTTPNYGLVLASYGSAKDRYRVKVRAGQEYFGLIGGVEAVLLGDQAYKENRIGIFVNAKRTAPVMFSVGAGFADPDSYRGDIGAYLTLEVSRMF